MRTLLTIIFFGLLNSVFGQDITDAHLKGKIYNYENSKLSINDSLISVSEGGLFKYSLRIKKLTEISIMYNNDEINIFLLPNEEQEFRFNSTSLFDSSHFEGNAEILNSLMIDIAKAERQITQFLNENWYSIYILDEEAFIKIIESEKIYLITLLIIIYQKTP